MKKLLLLLITSAISYLSFSQNVGIGTASPNSSALLDLSSGNKGLLPPRMTTGERNAIPAPAAGLMIFNTTTNSIEFFNGTSWFNFSNALNAATPIKKLWGGTQIDEVRSVDQTTDGGYIMAGYSSSSNTGTLTGFTTNGAEDAWIVKLDGSGIIQWQKLLGGSLDDVAYSVQQTTDGGYIVAGGSTSSNTGTLTGLISNGSGDSWILKLDGSGNLQWQKLLGGSLSDLALSVQQTADGGYIIAGFSNSSNTGTLTGLISNGATDYWIVKLDGSGNLQWQKLLGGSLNDFVNSIQQTADLGYVVAGFSLSSNTGTLTGLISNGSSDSWIIKLDASGNLQWQKLLGGSLSDDAYSVRQTTGGGYIVAGSSSSSNTGTLTGLISNGSIDYWIVKLDGSGNIQWQKLLGGSIGDACYSVQQTADGGYVVAGQSASSNTGTLTGHTGNGSYDYWIVKLDVNGNVLWQKLLGGSGDDIALIVRQTADGGYIVAGTSLSANTGTLIGIAGNGNIDAWIIKLDQYFNLL